MTTQETPQAVLDAIREMHPDPFTQVAILRLWEKAPGLLDEATAITLTNAATRTTT